MDDASLASAGKLALWGGIECTIARIGDEFRDQVRETGHWTRDHDLDLVAGLGIRTLRYPVLWETVAPERPDLRDFSWHDRRLGRLRELGINPIVGLVHHGSGPRYTNLLDPAFPRLLARYAAQVARRYPWIEAYTPVNEPLTTARFSGLYGHWYPHRHDYGAFLRALVNQCQATRLAMRAIRRVNPTARLVQTDDLGRTFSTPGLTYQAEHENDRRWLSFDLLLGRVDRHHPWWRILLDHGIGAEELARFADGEAAPDIIGINHYLTSDRFLDGRLGRYPQHLHGGNGQEAYADVEAVRVRLPGKDLGPLARLRETWDRYGIPIAVTEVHHGCTRDEQLRWLAEVWAAAERARQDGADVRAVTVWSLFGTTDWNTLLTRRMGIYEPGAFDIRGPSPRPTALAKAAASLAASGRVDHPVAAEPGWWRRDSRFYRSLPARQRAGEARRPTIAIAGPMHPLSAVFARLGESRGLALAWLDPGETRSADLLRERLGACGAWAAIDIGLGGPGTNLLAGVCHDLGLPILAISSAAALGPAGPEARAESEAAPKTGGAAALREAAIRSVCRRALVLRVGYLFDPWSADNLVWSCLGDLAAGRPILLPAGPISLSYGPDLVHVALDLLLDGESGLRHVANPSPLAAAEIGSLLAGMIGQERPEIRIGGEALPALTTARGDLMPPINSALDRFVRDCEIDWREAGGPVRVAAE